MKGTRDRRGRVRREKLNELSVVSQGAVYGAELLHDMQEETELSMVLYVVGNNRWGCSDIDICINKYICSIL